MKSLSGAKFMLLGLSCLLVDSYAPLRPYAGYTVLAKSESEGHKVEEICRRLGIPLVCHLDLPLPQ